MANQFNREHVVIYVGAELNGIKWRNYIMMRKRDRPFAEPIEENALKRAFAFQ